jgi:hypothetical protein
MGGLNVVQTFENFIYSLRTGRAGFEKAMGIPLFDYLG